jgi:type IV secretion system protein VirD4
MLVLNALGGNSKDPFWNTQASALLTILITILKKQEEPFQNLYNVRQLLNSLGSNPQSVDSLFSKYADDILFNEYKSFIAYDEKVVNGVIATCKAALQIFSDESVAKVTSYDNLNMQDFRDKPVVLFIQNSVADQKYYSVLTSLFFEQFFSYVLSRFPKQDGQDIFFLIDESSSLNLPTLPLAVANVRKHRAGIMLLVQDFAQVVHLYGKYDADAIKSNCFAKMFFTGQSYEMSKELEQTLGKYEYQEEDERKIKHKVVRSLMTNDEIRMMKSTRALIICGHHPPIQARLRPYYKVPLYKRFSSIPAPESKGEIIGETPPILMLNIHKEEICIGSLEISR